MRLLRLGSPLQPREMHNHAQPAALHRRMDQTMGVRAVQASFETMKDDEARLMARLMRVFAPGQIDKIAVWQPQGAASAG